jgi:2-polyprenyl-3-methyl-5-hydroxy-6-metoxy-1,4-benzoquinol methylase
VNCADCGTVYLHTRLTSEALDEFYQRYGEEPHMAIPETEEELATAGKRRPYFLKEIMAYDLPGRTILDVGCGWGAFLLQARENGFEPRGIEITRRGAEYATDTLGIPVSTTQLVDAQIEDKSISLVTMIHSLEHLPQTQSVLNKVFRLLQPNGLYCGMVPNIESVCSQVMGDNWYWLEPNAHIVYFSPGSLRSNLERAGFHVENIFTITGDYDWPHLKQAIRKLHGAELNDEKVLELIADADARGCGEEIRFFARKPR